MATAVFGICAKGFSNMAALKSQGYIDFIMENTEVNGPGGAIPGGFLSACNSNGVSSILQTSDSGSGGCGSQDCATYYNGLKSQGLMSAGGESESLGEVTALLGSGLVFMNYGGEGTGGPTGNNNIWAKTGGHCMNSGGATIASGQKCSTFLETYTTDSMLPASEMGTEAGYNHDAGCFEVGVLVGNWAEAFYGAGASTYEEMYDEIKSAIGACAGFQYWYVSGDSGGFSSDVMSGLLGAYTHDTRTITARAGGAPPGPGPTPAPGTAPNVNINVRQRLYQPSRE